MSPCFRRVLFSSALLIGSLLGGNASGALTPLGFQYQPDRLFPEHQCFWNSGCGPASPGANLHVYVRNTGTSSVTIDDVRFVGFNLSDILRLHYQVAKRQPASIWLDNLSTAQLNTLVAAGEPVWYKIDPPTIDPGQSGQIVVRLRSVPTIPNVNLEIVSSAGTVSISVPVAADAPQLASVSFSADLAKVHLYWRRPGGIAPNIILLDGNTMPATTVFDPAVDLAVTVLQLSQPLAAGSLHVFQGIYADGRTATAGLRAWANNFLYGTWGGQDVPDGDDAAARAVLIDAVNHGANSLVNNGSAVTSVLMKSNSGQQFVADHDYGFVVDAIGKWAADHPRMWFIRDEPDWADYRLDSLPENKKIGCLGQMCLQMGEGLRPADPTAPTTLNINAYSAPYCWYNYGKLPDVFMTDPYYQARLREVIWGDPNRVSLYEKATYIYAVAQVAQASCEPDPLHMVLYSCEFRDTSSGATFPFPTPQSKRIEVYYGLAGGAKGFSYWWWPAGGQSNGLGDGGPEAQALWKEIGLLGNEIKTAAPLLVVSCPITVPTQASPGVWARALAVGRDTMILLAVNDQYRNDEDGIHYSPVANANLAVTLPTWLVSPSAFEISASGTGDVTSQVIGSQLQLNLDTLDITRMVVVTTNPQLRSSIQQRYEQQVQAAVCAIAPEVCSQEIPPTITRQPEARNVCRGTTAVFNVVASAPGTPTYRWQKDGADLGNGGHYSGTATSTLAITPADDADAGQFRCVVSNAYGSTTSNEASLAVIACNPGCMQNLGFESGFTNGIGSGWTKFTKIGSVQCSEESAAEYVHGGLRSQRIYAASKNNDGGVYQQFAATPGQPYTLRAWLKVHSGQTTGNAEGFFGVDPTGGTDPNSANIVWASKPWEYWSQDSATVIAQNSAITVYLRGRATRLNQTAYIWVDDVELAPGYPTGIAPLVLGPGTIRWRWVDLLIETGYRVRDSGGTDRSGLLAANTVQWTETGLTPNTPYTRTLHAINDCGESDPSSPQTAWTLSVPPTTGSITPDNTHPCPNSTIMWAATGGFGPAAVQYYRYAWDQNPDHEWTGSEPQWLSGTISTSATATGTWYLHVQGYNGQDVANGTYDYDLAVDGTAGPDLDCDGNVDQADFDLFLPCVLGPAVRIQPGCENRDFDKDSDVDQSDFGMFQRCLSGPDRAFDPSCLN